MTVESQINAATEQEVMWPVLAEHFRQLMETLFPSASQGELSDKASLRGLEVHLASGSLPPEHEVLLRDYLDSLPGYGNPDWKEEAERHHGFVASYYLRQKAKLAHE